MRARKLGTIVLIAVCAAGGLWLFAAVLFPLLLPLFIGLAVAAMARKPVSMLERQTKLPRGLAAFLCVLGIYALAGTGLFLLCRLLCREVGGFLHQLPALAARLEEPAKALQDRLYAIADKFPDGVGSGLRAGLTSFFESGAGLGAKLYERLFTLASGFLGKLPDLVLGAVTALLSSFMLTAEFDDLAGAYRRHVPKNWQEKLSFARTHLSSTLGAWLRAQGKLMGVTFLILTAGFLLLGVDYALLFALLTTFIDALPVFGTGTVLLPWSLLEFIRGNARRGVGFLLLYAASWRADRASARGDAGGIIRRLPRDGRGGDDRVSAPFRFLLPDLPGAHGKNAGGAKRVLTRRKAGTCELACSFGFFAV